MLCNDCKYTYQVQRKYGVTTHCTLEPTNMDVTYCVHKNEENELCPIIHKGTRRLDFDEIYKEQIK